MIYKFYLVLGDWSDDGHGKSDKVLIESNYSEKDLQKAYKKSCKKTGISFNHNDNFTGKKDAILICTDYEDSQITEEAYRALAKLNCPFNDLEFDGIGCDEVTEDNCDELYLNQESFTNLLMWFIGLSMPEDFEWKEVEDKIPYLNGYWDKSLNVQFGYGLYY